MSRIYAEVFGCSANVADYEIALGLLSEAGHQILKSPDNADAIIILTCIVKTPTERKMIKRLKKLKELSLPIIVAGCMPVAQRNLVESIVPRASLMGPNQVHQVVDVLSSVLQGRRVEVLQSSAKDKTFLPRVRRNPIIHISPISTGCLGDCSYCIVKKARGLLHSFRADQIVEEAKQAIAEGSKEIWITAEDTASYSWRDFKLPGLLTELSNLEGKFYIRVGMMTPNQALPLLDKLVEAYKSEKVFKFLHLPIQSGSEEILRKMRRQYSVDDFRSIVTQFRREFPYLNLSTDIICGFPGETEEQFKASLDLVEETQPDTLNISRFWPRPGTDAAKLERQLHSRETKNRSRTLTRLWRHLSEERNLRWVGWKGEVVIDEQGRHQTSVGRNYAYKPVVISPPAEIGDILEVEIIEAKRGYLLGNPV